MDSDLPVAIRPLDVEIGGAEKFGRAETVQELVSMLLGGSWPGGGPKFRVACWRAMEAIEWYIDAEAARAAFIDAAHEAAMRVLPDDVAEMDRPDSKEPAA